MANDTNESGKEANLAEKICAGEEPVQEIDLLIGAVFAKKYRVIEKLGSGGMGAVYKAEHMLMGRTVALKLLHKYLAANASYLKRFRREAQVASKIVHPNAITLYDFGIEDETPFLVMEFVGGQTLKSLLQTEGKLSASRVGNILRHIAGPLSEAHRLGIVHRDLKPDNILVTSSTNGVDTVRVLDFGIAKMVGFVSGEKGVVSTQTGVFMGTPQYMSPEQAMNKDVDSRSDLYSLGIILYEMITGEVPFVSDSAVELLFQHVHGEPKPLRQLKGDTAAIKAINSVLLKALEKDPTKRYQTVEQLVAEYERIVESKIPVPISSRARTPSRLRPVAIGGAALGLLALITFAALGGKEINEETVVQAAPITSEAEPTKPAPQVKPASSEKTSDSEDIRSRLAKELEEYNPVSTPQTKQQPAATVKAPEPVKVTQPTTPVIQAAPASSEPATLEKPKADTMPVVATTPTEAPKPVVPTVTETPKTVPVPPAQPTIPVAKNQPPAKPEQRVSGENAERLFQEGTKFLKQKDYRKAEEYFQAAVNAKPDHLMAHLSLGLASLRLQKPTVAIAEFEKALALDPQYAPTHYNIATYYSLMNNRDAAFGALEKAVRLFPDLREWAKKDPDFKSLREDPRFVALVGD